MVGNYWIWAALAVATAGAAGAALGWIATRAAKYSRARRLLLLSVTVIIASVLGGVGAAVAYHFQGEDGLLADYDREFEIHMAPAAYVAVLAHNDPAFYQRLKQETGRAYVEGDWEEVRIVAHRLASEETVAALPYLLRADDVYVIAFASAQYRSLWRLSRDARMCRGAADLRKAPPLFDLPELHAQGAALVNAYRAGKGEFSQTRAVKRRDPLSGAELTTLRQQLRSGPTPLSADDLEVLDNLGAASDADVCRVVMLFYATVTHQLPERLAARALQDFWIKTWYLERPS